MKTINFNYKKKFNKKNFTVSFYCQIFFEYGGIFLNTQYIIYITVICVTAEYNFEMMCILEEWEINPLHLTIHNTKNIDKLKNMTLYGSILFLLC
jgi:hypothetical protein